jgi:hypothetical protein
VAAALIEVLEVIDCGSVGGYDKRAPLPAGVSYKLYARFIAVLRKHNKDKDIKGTCGASVRRLAVYFNTLAGLRDMVYEMSNPELARSLSWMEEK